MFNFKKREKRFHFFEEKLGVGNLRSTRTLRVPCWHSDEDEERFDEEGTGSSLVCLWGWGHVL